MIMLQYLFKIHSNNIIINIFNKILIKYLNLNLK